MEIEDDFGSLDPEEAQEVLSSLTPLEKLRFLIERSKKTSQITIVKEKEDTIKKLQADHEIQINHLKDVYERKIRDIQEEQQRKLLDVEKRSEHEKNRLIVLHDGEAAHFKTEMQRLEERNNALLSQRDESLKQIQQFQRELTKVQDQLTKEKMEHLKTKNRLQISESQLRTLRSFAKSFLKLDNARNLEPPKTPASEQKELPRKSTTTKKQPVRPSKTQGTKNTVEDDLDLDDLDFGSASEVDDLNMDELDMSSSSEKSVGGEKKVLGESVGVGVSEDDLEVDNIEQFIKQTLENFDRTKQELQSEREHNQFLDRMLQQEKEINHSLLDHIEGLKQNLVVAHEEITRVKTVDMKRLQDQIKVLSSNKEKLILEAKVKELEEIVQNQQQTIDDSKTTIDRQTKDFAKLQEELQIVTNEKEVEKKWRMEKVHECILLSEELQREQQKYAKTDEKLREMQKENRKMMQFLNQEFLHYNLNAIHTKRIQNQQQENYQRQMDSLVQSEKKLLKETLGHLKDATNTHQQVKMELEAKVGKPPMKLNRSKFGAWYEKEEGEISSAFSSDLPKLSLKMLKNVTVSPTSSVSSLRSDGEVQDLKIEDLEPKWVPLDDSKSEGEI